MTGAGEDLDPRTLAALLDGARRAAMRAGDAILAVACDGNHDARSKDDTSPVTRADLAAHDVLVEALGALIPRAPIVSEESSHPCGDAPRRFWLIDPLDGTREFLAGNGEYTVNVAFVEDGISVLGVVHAPARGVTYAAARDQGAVRIDRDGEHVVRARTDGALVVLTSRSHPSVALDAFLAALPPHDLRTMGSALKMCLVADGAAQLYPRLGPTCWWDTAAAQRVAMESGATVTALDGAPLRYAGTDVRNPSFVCASIPRSMWLDAARAAG